MRPSKLAIAGVQMDIRLGDKSANLDSMRLKFREAVQTGARLVVFPECTTTGYCFDSLDDANDAAEPLNGPSCETVATWCRQDNAHAVFGFLESEGGQLYNSLVLIGPHGTLTRYRKNHLPFLGVDRFVTPGDQVPDVVDIEGVRVGLNICYDSAFPESARILALAGADLIILSTNWPPTSSLASEIFPSARAMENQVYFMATNRIGHENGFDFIGKSRICSPSGEVIVVADHANDAILHAEIDPALARSKHRVTIPGEHEVHRMKDRRPEIYRSLTTPFSEPYPESEPAESETADPESVGPAAESAEPAKLPEK